jgi:hypothetical protein
MACNQTVKFGSNQMSCSKIMFSYWFKIVIYVGYVTFIKIMIKHMDEPYFIYHIILYLCFKYISIKSLPVWSLIFVQSKRLVTLIYML